MNDLQIISTGPEQTTWWCLAAAGQEVGRRSFAFPFVSVRTGGTGSQHAGINPGAHAEEQVPDWLR